MESIFLVCAVIGGTMLICQFLMTLFGLAGHGADFGSHGGDVGGGHEFGGHDSHTGNGHAHDSHDQSHGATWLFSVITLRTMVAAIAFFGLAGMAATQGGLPPAMTLSIAIASGVAAMLGVHALMQSLHKLRADGTMRIERAVGIRGTVYLSIPAGNSGAGKVQIKLQSRLVELQAMTSATEPIASGTSIVVTGVLGPGTVAVEPISENARPLHV